MCPFASKADTQLAYGRIQAVAERQHWRQWRAGRRFAIPNDMKDDFLESRIPIVTMGTPAAWPQVHLNVPAARLIITELDYCAAKVWSALETAKSGMQHADLNPVTRSQLLTAKALVLPNGLEQDLRWRLAVFPQNRNHRAFQPPLCVNISFHRRVACHCFCAEE